ncbi:hypothetical protein COY87_03775 [Candidatus Roizmanbacteria bacterium CG_4_10_14_0_8_um_filter_33_9]|uniref:UmuC domain-containing protein n=1 Tax=Candidatus Roizmanbacteria bacterium CG_4_10_14_0_8_um_filter_33_9 TaxID=1974826 RepID=A0A2M7QHU4_9BACT|nr:MAG: hypothetical protein COY87_03775 [Candidatus Roizmanbacteria bacterium CG_4_10_14_0_8_um_filter_33_9]
MELPLNKNKPLVMHIDLNSCFATVCQQAHIHLRGKPVVIAAYPTNNGCILSPSIEAKKLGIKVGMRVRDAKLISKDVIVRETDPMMVRDVHIKFKKIFQDYTPYVTPQSIDEAVLDFTGMESFLKRSLTNIAQEIKIRLRKEIGEWISCSIGIGTNRFLAKTGASIKKPDGLELINHTRIKEVYGKLALTDLNGINKRFEVRLNMQGIFTPLQFLYAPLPLLQKQVFQSILGYYWFLRLRGYEIDNVEFSRKSFGQDYALGKKTADVQELSVILMKLCEKMGRRLRRAGYEARGLHIAFLYNDYTFWHKGKKGNTTLSSTVDLYKNLLLLFHLQPEKKVVIKISISCYDLVKKNASQLELFDEDRNKKTKVSETLDKVNDQYGEFTIIPALMMESDNLALDRIAFGGVKELEDLYSSKQ